MSVEWTEAVIEAPLAAEQDLGRRELARMRAAGPGGPAEVVDELVAQGLVGSMEGIFVRASADPRYTAQDAPRTNLCISLAVAAA